MVKKPLLNTGDRGETAIDRLSITVDRTKPLVVQITDQIARLLAARVLPLDERLPPADEFAKRVGVAKPTLIAAYQLLQTHGITTNTTGVGVYFTPTAEQSARRYLISRDAEVLINNARALGLTDDEVVGVFLAVAQRMESEKIPTDSGTDPGSFE